MISKLNKFNLDFCRGKSPAKLRTIYKTENPELIEELIEAVHGKQEINTVEEVQEVQEVKDVKRKKKSE